MMDQIFISVLLQRLIMDFGVLGQYCSIKTLRTKKGQRLNMELHHFFKITY